MISSIANDMLFLLHAQFAPFLMVVLSIILVIISQIIRLPLLSIFIGAFLCLTAAWSFCFFATDSSPIVYGLYFDSLSRMAIQLLIPAVIGVGLMIYYKDANQDKKVASLILLLISFLGGMVVLTSQNWMVFFVGIQCMSIPVYGLMAFDTDSQIALSASVRYLVLSIVAMAFLLFGIVLLYAATGTMGFISPHEAMPSKVMLLGMAFVFVGIGFKISLAPFHLWAPEVYQGASFFVTTFLLVIVKAVIVFFLVRNFSVLVGVDLALMTTVLSTMAMLSMWIGNGMMLAEKNFMRLLGFLSIGHLGFILIPLLTMHRLGAEAIFIDLSAFGLAILLVIMTVKLLAKKSIGSWSIENFTGLAKEQPLLSFFLVVGLSSLAGLPLTAGFIGKYAILVAGVSSQMWILSINMLLSSLLAIVALARIVIAMLQAKTVIEQKTAATTRYSVLLVSALALMFFGVFPEPWISWVKMETKKVSFDVAKSTYNAKLPTQLSALPDDIVKTIGL